MIEITGRLWTGHSADAGQSASSHSCSAHRRAGISKVSIAIQKTARAPRFSRPQIIDPGVSYHA
jgi:hypothetical protein